MYYVPGISSEGYGGLGIGKGLSAGAGASFVVNPTQASQLSVSAQGDLGVGFLGGQAQASLGTDSGFGTSHTLIAAPVGTKIGAAVSATGNSELIEQIIDAGC